MFRGFPQRRIPMCTGQSATHSCAQLAPDSGVEGDNGWVVPLGDVALVDPRQRMRVQVQLPIGQAGQGVCCAQSVHPKGYLQHRPAQWHNHVCGPSCLQPADQLVWGLKPGDTCHTASAGAASAPCLTPRSHMSLR